MLLLSFDFDGTIAITKWPAIIKWRRGARFWLKWAKKRGHKLQLNTCREREYLQDAKNFMNKSGVFFDYYNENEPKRIDEFWDCRKLGFDWLFDDKAGFLGWLSVPLIVLWLEWKYRKVKAC